jgi:hypothetical protein
MTMPADLFRREALEYRARQHGPGSLLRLGSPWLRWLFWLVLGLTALGVALGLGVRVDQTATGPARLDPHAQTFVAALPVDADAGVHDGSPLRLEVRGPAGRRSLPAEVRHVAPAEQADVERAGLPPFPQAAVLVTGVVVAGGDTEDRAAGRAVLDLGSQQAFALLLHGFEGTPQGGQG